MFKYNFSDIQKNNSRIFNNHFLNRQNSIQGRLGYGAYSPLDHRCACRMPKSACLRGLNNSHGDSTISSRTIVSTEPLKFRKTTTLNVTPLARYVFKTKQGSCLNELIVRELIVKSPSQK